MSRFRSSTERDRGTPATLHTVDTWNHHAHLDQVAVALDQQ
ncbi:hypothetical protein OG239_03480 [Streptomyces sp. NBC_00868]|nr:hypothetical protein OG239_03480 [Streptomyces sp. NBC_00868]